MTQPVARPPSDADQSFMAAALSLARRGLGNVWPNPAVGCVIVRDGRVVGRGWTQPGGRPHAETEALARAGAAAHGATAYVTLEPCAHHGETPPCADALVNAGIAEAVVAIRDPDPRVSGQGVQRLLAAGIPVVEGVQAEAAAEANAGFLCRIERGWPLITLKLATTLDGRIATATGESRWITGPEARASTHGLRLRHDAVVVGSGTVLADDPELTCRLPGCGPASRNLRIVVDGRLRLTPAHKLAATAREVPTWLVTTSAADRDGRARLEDMGVEVLIASASAEGRPDIRWTVQELARRGLTRVLVEGGAAVASSLLAAGLVDRVAWFRAPAVIGDDGRAAVDAMAIARLDEAPRLLRDGLRAVGADHLETYHRRS